MPELQWLWLWLLLMGFGTGVYGVMVGAGGGFILGPLLLIFFGMDPQIVAGTVLALVAANSISGGITFRRMGIVDKRSAYLFALAAIPGSVVAPFILKELVKDSPGIFNLLFGVMLLLLAARLMGPRPRDPEEPSEEEFQVKSKWHIGSMKKSRTIVSSETGRIYRYRFNEFLATFVNFILGFISSFFGTGGGFLRTPILVYAFGFPVQIAVATSIFTLSFYTTAGAITHAFLGNIDWFPTFVFAGIGLVTGGQLGARLTNRVRGPWILRLLMIVVLALGVRLIYQGIRG